MEPRAHRQMLYEIQNLVETWRHGKPNRWRISGNLFNVPPNGVSDYNVNGQSHHDLQAFVEIGRAGANTVVGTDGDGSLPSAVSTARPSRLPDTNANRLLNRVLWPRERRLRQHFPTRTSKCREG